MNDNGASRVYLGLRFFSGLFFAVVVTMNLVYQAVVVGLDPLQLVLVGTLLEATCFLFEIPTGVVADLYSRKLSVIIGTVLIGLGFVIEGSFPNFLAVLFAQIVWGIGATFVSGVPSAFLFCRAPLTLSSIKDKIYVLRVKFDIQLNPTRAVFFSL